LKELTSVVPDGTVNSGTQAELAELRSLKMPFAVSYQGIPAQVVLGAVAPLLNETRASSALLMSPLTAAPVSFAMFISC
jgi:hypothetical protein